MNYELAKELKKAGFRVPVGASPLWQPTLSELIEACGDDFNSLSLTIDEHTKERLGFCAWQRGVHESSLEDTPEEAVARLWLALHPN